MLLLATAWPVGTDRQQGCIKGNAVDAAVVARCQQDARHFGAMAIFIAQPAWSGGIAAERRDPPGEFGAGRIDAAVDHRDDDIAARGAGIISGDGVR